MPLVNRHPQRTPDGCVENLGNSCMQALDRHACEEAKSLGEKTAADRTAAEVHAKRHNEQR